MLEVFFFFFFKSQIPGISELKPEHTLTYSHQRTWLLQHRCKISGFLRVLLIHLGPAALFEDTEL